MTSQVGIYNRAIQKVGGQPVTSINDDTVSGRACNRCYTALRDAELRLNNWNFAIKRDSLAEDATAPAWGYGSRFLLPSDFIRLIEVDGMTGINEPIGDYGRAVPDYTIENQYILCDDEGPLDIRYVARVSETTIYDPLFVEALASKMAIEICEEVTQNTTKKDMLIAQYKQAITDARKCDAIETPGDPLYEDDWILARI